jgi:hypothetical protein
MDDENIAPQPVRVQLRRTKGWRMPPNTVKVDRTTRWGNPYPVARTTRIHPAEAGYTAEQAVSAFKGRMHGLLAINAVDLSALRGKNLACWCPLTDKDGNHVPCHADVLLELANALEVRHGYPQPSLCRPLRPRSSPQVAAMVDAGRTQSCGLCFRPRQCLSRSRLPFYRLL